MICRYCISDIPDGAPVCPVCHGDFSKETPPHHLPPGTILNGRYYVGSAIGEGGFSIVYAGRDRNIDLKVAIKEFYPTGYVNRVNTGSPTVYCGTGSEQESTFRKGVQRFMSESHVLARFDGEDGVVSVRDCFEANGTAYIVMEFLDGERLKDYLEKKKKLLPEETLSLLMPVMLSLQKVHAKGLIHRDIAPDNIMLAGGKVKLIDFGAARGFESSKSLSVMLKHGYAPFEQYSPKGKQGPWTDVYALCATMYKCITGVTPDDCSQRVFHDELVPPSAFGVEIDQVFEEALMKGMRIRPGERYQDIAELLDGFGGRDREILDAVAAKKEEKAAQQAAAGASPAEDAGGPKSADPDKTVYIGGEAAGQSVPADSEKTVFGGADSAQEEETGVQNRTPVDPDKTVCGGDALQYEQPVPPPKYHPQTEKPRTEPQPQQKPKQRTVNRVTAKDYLNAEEEKRKKGSRLKIGKKLLIIIGALILIAAAVAVIIAVASSGKNSSGDSSSDPAATTADPLATTADPLAMTFSVGGYSYSLPCYLSAFTVDGWSTQYQTVNDGLEVYDLALGSDVIRVGCGSDDRVYQVYLVNKDLAGTGASVSLPGGIGFSSTQSEIIAKYGEPKIKESAQWIYVDGEGSTDYDWTKALVIDFYYETAVYFTYLLNPNTN